MRVFVVLCSLLLVASPIAAHSGGTDASGCHVDSSTGARHCHGGGGGGAPSSSGGSNDNGPILIVIGVVLVVFTVGSALAAVYFLSRPSPTDYKSKPSYSPTVYCKEGDIGCLVPLLSP